MHTKPAYDTGLDEGIRYGWIESLDWILGVIDEEIDYQEESVSGTTQTASVLYRIHAVANGRRRELIQNGDG